MPKLYYASPRDLPIHEPQPGVKGTILHAENGNLVLYEYAPKTIVETHKHEVEQFGVVVKGSLAMVVAGEQRILNAGDTFRIPANAAHGARIFEETSQVVEVFAPARADLPKARPPGL